MKYEDKVTYLKSYQLKSDRLLFLDTQIQGVHSISHDGIRGYSKKTMHDYLDEKNTIIQELHTIENIINNLTDERYRYVLQYRFMIGMKLLDISEVMNYSLSHIKRLYKAAIEQLDI